MWLYIVQKLWLFSNSDNSNSELLSSVSSVNLVTNSFNTCQHIINDDNKTWVCVCVSSCNWRPFQTEPGPWRSGGRDNHRCSAGVSICSHKCPITSIDHTDSPAHQLFTLTSKVSALKHTAHRFQLHWCRSYYLFIFNRHAYLLMCVLHVHAVCLTAVSTLAASCAPPSNPLSPSWTPSHPYPHLCSLCQRDSCALQRAMFWVLEQGGRPMQQLPLSIYTFSIIPASHLHLPWSDLDFCFTPSPLFSALSSVSVPLFTRSSGHFQPSAQSQEQIWIWSYNGDWVCGVYGVTDWRGWFGLSLWSSAPLWLSPSLFSCWLHTSIASSSHCLPEGPATWSIWCVQTAPAFAMPGAVGAEGGKMKAGSKSESTSRSRSQPRIGSHLLQRCKWQAAWKVYAIKVAALTEPACDS